MLCHTYIVLLLRICLLQVVRTYSCNTFFQLHPKITMHSVISVISFYENANHKLILHWHKIKSSIQIYIPLICDKCLVYQLFVRQLLLAYLIGSFQNFGT